jgi:uncharacterized protein DUF1918
MSRKPKSDAASRQRAVPGDWVVIHGHTVGEPARRGLIVEVLGEPSHEHYLVRWDEEHVSIFYPGSDASIVKDVP